MADRLDVFVSATTLDLKSFRVSVARKLLQLGHYPVEQANFDPDYRTIHEKLNDKISTCDALIHIAGFCYGSEPLNRPAGKPRWSYTQLEFHIASELKVPIYVFVASEQCVFAKHKPEPTELLELQLAHLDFLRARDRDCTEFSSLEKLLDLIARIQFPRSVSHFAIPPRNDGPGFRAIPPYISGHPFVGRRAELGMLEAWVKAPEPAMVIEAIGGAGKSLLAWTWANRASTDDNHGFVGVFWYSLYERGADLRGFLRSALAYFGDSAGKCSEYGGSDLVDRILEHLAARKWLICMDGLERMLAAYQRIDYTQARDDQVLTEHESRECARRDDTDILRRLCCERHSSKVLVTTRLFPVALESNSRLPLPGVRHISLEGLEPMDAERILRDMGVSGRSEDMQHYLSTLLGCHPLLVGVVAGLVVNYFKQPSNFDAWMGDDDGGAFIRLSQLNLTQRRNHVLKSSILALSLTSRKLLCRLALLIGAADYETTRAIGGQEHLSVPGTDLDFNASLEDLRRRGLLNWDRSHNEFDLHPVVRGYVVDSMSPSDISTMGNEVVDFFSSRAPRTFEHAISFDHVKDAIQIVLTLLRLGKPWRALERLNGELAAAMLWNIDLYREYIDLARLYLATQLDIDNSYDFYYGNHQAGHADLLSDYSIALRQIGLTEQALRTSEEVIDFISHEFPGTPRDPEWQDNIRHLRTMLVNAIEHNAWSLAEKVFRKMTAHESEGHQDRVSHLWKMYYYVNTHQTDRAKVECASIDGSANRSFRKALQNVTRLLVDQNESSDPRSLTRSVFRNGTDLSLKCELLALENKLELHHLDQALEVSQANSNRLAIRSLKRMRAEFLMVRNRWEEAAEEWRSLLELLTIARVDKSTIEARFAIVQFRIGNVAESLLAAQRLKDAIVPSLHVHLAELFFLHDRREDATYQLHRAYDEAAAEGWPHSNRSALEVCHRVADMMTIPRSLPPSFSQERLRYRLTAAEAVFNS